MSDLVIGDEGYYNGYKQGKAEGREEVIEEFLNKAKELYPNDNGVIYKAMCIAGQLKEKKNE